MQARIELLRLCNLDWFEGLNKPDIFKTLLMKTQDEIISDVFIFHCNLFFGLPTKEKSLNHLKLITSLFDWSSTGVSFGASVFKTKLQSLADFPVKFVQANLKYNALTYWDILSSRRYSSHRNQKVKKPKIIQELLRWCLRGDMEVL